MRVGQSGVVLEHGELQFEELFEERESTDRVWRFPSGDG